MNTLFAMGRLQEAVKVKGPLCTGIDTDSSYLPPEVLSQYDSPSQAVLAYNLGLIEATAPYSACFKVQIAYYEAMGLAGLDTYVKTLKAIKASGVPVIADIKRGDIADTAKAYAKAHFTGDFEADIITLNPYMGFDTLAPFTEYISPEKGGKGAFVLLRTSNPGMVDIEKQELAKGGYVLDHVGSELLSIAEKYAHLYPGAECAPFGAVVGCTEESDARALRDTYPNIFFLIPGYGAQGGAARIAATLLDKAGGVVNSSRGILCAWKKDESIAAKKEAGSLTLNDIVASAEKAAKEGKADLLKAASLLGIQ